MLPAFEYVQTTIEAKVNDERFIAKGKIVISKGWKNLYDKIEEDSSEDDIKEQILPNINKNDKFIVESISLNRGETKPPSKFM